MISLDTDKLMTLLNNSKPKQKSILFFFNLNHIEEEINSR